MQLNGKARTGLVEVNSNEDEGTPVMGAIHGNVLALEHAHVIVHIIGVSFTVRSSCPCLQGRLVPQILESWKSRSARRQSLGFPRGTCVKPAHLFKLSPIECGLSPLQQFLEANQGSDPSAGGAILRVSIS